MIEAILWSISALLNSVLEKLMVWFNAVLLYKVPHMKKPPGPLANIIPVLGSLPLFAVKPSHEVLTKISENYNRIYRLEFGQTTFIVICDHVLLQDAFAMDVACGRNMPKMMDVMNQQGLIHADGNCWRNQRYFVHQTLRGIGLPATPENPAFNIKSSDAIAAFIKELKATKGNPTFVDEALCFTLVNTFFSMIVGKNFDRDDELLKAIINSTHESYRATDIISFANYVPFFAGLPMNKRILEDISVRKERFTNYMQAIIQEHRNNLDTNNLKDLVDTYLVQMSEGRTFFSEPQLQAIIGDLFTANVENISATIHWLLLAMIKYPDIQEKIHKELDEVVNKDQVPTLEDRIKTPYMEAVILEGYRFPSILPFGIPHCMTEDTTLSGYVIPKNATVVGLFWKFNRDPALWDNPSCFDPRNHLNYDGVVVRNPYLMPYSSGRRACMTEAVANDMIYLILANLLHAFNIQPAMERVDLPSFEASQDGVVRVPTPFQVRFVPRPAK